MPGLGNAVPELPDSCRAGEGGLDVSKAFAVAAYREP